MKNQYQTRKEYRESRGTRERLQDWIGGNSENYMDMETGKAYPWPANCLG